MRPVDAADGRGRGVCGRRARQRTAPPPCRGPPHAPVRIDVGDDRPVPASADLQMDVLAEANLDDLVAGRECGLRHRGPVFAGRRPITSSTNRSWTSPPVVVMPQAKWSVMAQQVEWHPRHGPAGTGCPPGVTIRARYQRIGAPSPRWGSLASIGLPLLRQLPSTTHWFEACRGPSTAAGCAAKRRQSIPSSEASVRGPGGGASGTAILVGMREQAFLQIGTTRLSRKSLLSCNDISRAQTRLSAGRQGSGVMFNSWNSSGSGASGRVEIGIDPVGIGVEIGLGVGA